ncbi:flagellar hook-associated protein FlgK [Propionispira raffinosivorans]|uniref:flagellar hook-associated protein FlgK n=1 Tax=Propionispira raffinosivorans TaxID=86959 RepID=UPI000378B606|nr:flagellar hook-associated protein FlgK [Propionispira raffinosivorans]
MRSTFAGLNTMFSGLNANQVSLDTVGHNITNASVDGYSRQNVNLAATKSQTVPTMYGSAELGTGVNTISVTRARDAFADKAYRKDSSDLNYADTRQTNYDKLEAIYNDSTDTGVQKSINNFWSAWKALASDAGQSTTTTTRQTVVSAGDKLAQNLQSSTAKTQTLISDENTQLELQVKTVNGLTSDILDLNKQITQAESTGAMANDLRDSRDLKVDQLSKLVKVSVDQKSDGSYSIVSNGNTLVDAHTRLTLKVTSTPNLDYGVNDDVITIAETGGAYDAGNGEIKGLQDSIAENKGYIDNMAAMGSYLLTTFNDQHKAGYDLNNNKGVNFYGETSDTYKYGSGTTTKTDSLGTTTTLKPIDIINSLTVNTAILATNGTSLIAARSSGEGSAGAANATLLGGLLHDTADSASGSLGNTTFAAYYTGVTNKLGSDAQATDNTVTNQEDLLTVSTNWRSSTSGVNWDEELTNMIKFQKGYSSCARCLTTMDEMLDKLINSTGTVGR